jgi:hypothetical protein
VTKFLLPIQTIADTNKLWHYVFMPSITGGSSTSIDYAPHMYVLREGGESRRDDDYIFVGNAEASYEATEQYGATYEERLEAIAALATAVHCSSYHIGISATEGLVGDITTKKIEVVDHGSKKFLTSSLVPDSHRGIPALEIPEAAKKELLKVGLRQIGTFTGHAILGGLGIELPDDIEPLDFGKVFNGTPEEQTAQRAQNERWELIAKSLRQTFKIK